jgi:hypothetical protein
MTGRPPAAGTRPWVGAYVGQQGQPSPNWQALWNEAHQAIGPLTYWRCFDNTIKQPGAARFTQVTGPRVFYSLKPPRRRHRRIRTR